MPSPKKGVAEGATRKVKVEEGAKRPNGIPTTSMAAFLSGKPFPKPPTHPGRAHKVTQNAREAARKGMNTFEQRSYTRSKSKSAGPSPYRMLSATHRRELMELKEKGYNIRSILGRLQAKHAPLERLTRPSASKVPHSRSSSATSEQQLGEKYIYYTEGGEGRSIQLKHISLDSDLISLLRAEEMGWLIKHQMARK